MTDGIEGGRNNGDGDHRSGRGTEQDEGTEMGEEDYKIIRQTHLVVATLITTITFTAGLTLPEWYKSNECRDQGQGRALQVRIAAFKAFVIANAVAMSFSFSAISVYLMSSLTKRKWELENQFMWGLYLLLYAMMALMIAFISGSYFVLGSSSSDLAIGVIVIGCSCVLGNRVISFGFTKSAYNTWLLWYFGCFGREVREGREEVPNPFAFMITLAKEKFSVMRSRMERGR